MRPESILQSDSTRCYICRRADEKLDLHHVFFGALRKKSDKYGCVVWLCHNRCHIFGENAVHRNREIDLRLKKKCQLALMKKAGWTVEQFRAEFYKNYLDEEDIENGEV